MVDRNDSLVCMFTFYTISFELATLLAFSCGFKNYIIYRSKKIFTGHKVKKCVNFFFSALEIYYTIGSRNLVSRHCVIGDGTQRFEDSRRVDL